jgi:6-phosphofructokinase
MRAVRLAAAGSRISRRGCAAGGDAKSSTYLDDAAVIILGGDGSLRGARAVYEGFGVQVVGLPGTIDINIEARSRWVPFGRCAGRQSIESLKATSAAMGSIFFVEVMGAGLAIWLSAARIRRGQKACW